MNSLAHRLPTSRNSGNGLERLRADCIDSGLERIAKLVSGTRVHARLYTASAYLQNITQYSLRLSECIYLIWLFHGLCRVDMCRINDPELVGYSEPSMAMDGAVELLSQ